MGDNIPLVRCHLDGPEEARPLRVRYVPLAEFGLWRSLMETRHGRQVSVEEVSIWVAEEAARWNSGWAADILEPVLRVRFEAAGLEGIAVPVERFIPAETYPQALEALLSHYGPPLRLVAEPGYFVPADGSTGEVNAA